MAHVPHDEKNPFVMLEVDSLLLARTAQHEKGYYGKHHANPLIKVQAFAKHKHGTYKHHHGARRINRSHDGQRQMLHPEITEYPGREHDKRLDNNKLMHLPPHHGNIKHRTSQHRRRKGRYQNERKKYQAREQRVQEKYRQYGIVTKRLLLEDIVKSQ